MKSGNLQFLILTTYLILISHICISQKEYAKNPHVDYNIAISDDNYHISYTFMDHFDNFQTFELILPVEFTENEITVFGVPSWLFNPYSDTEYNRQIRNKELSKGLFKLSKNTIEVDKSAVLRRYAETFCKPIAGMIVESLEEYGRDTRRDRIELAIRFVQDIPYGIPQYSDKARHYGGVIPPPALLKNGYGDCDSKVLLFAGILIYLIPGNEIIFLNQADHVLSAVFGEKEEGLTYVNFMNKNYLVAETSGPGQRKLGEKGNYFRNKFTAEPLDFDLPEPLPFDPDAIAVRSVSNNSVDKNKVVIKNMSANYFKFQLSYDNKNWQDFNLKNNESGIFNLTEKDFVMLRIRERSKGFAVYKILPGNSYSFHWDNHYEKWEPDFKVF
jgi:hypothetical protein